MTQPWWFSGDQPSAAQASRFDLGSLAVGAQQLVDWARAVIVDPHVGHDDPAAHPQCPLCRASGLLGDSARPAVVRSRIDWIELRYQDGNGVAR